LSPCFVWGENKGGKIVPIRGRKTGAEKKWSVIGIRTEFAKSFVDARAHPSVQEVCDGLGYDLGKIFPIFSSALPITYTAPVITSMVLAQEYLQLCRLQRQSDEKGLSAWSCGFAACGNPTKFQLRIQRKLSLILGHLLYMGGKGRLIIIDDAYAELEYINRQIILWKTKVSALDKSRHLFYCPSIAGMTRKLEGFITTSTQFQPGDKQLFLSSCQLEQKRSTEWTKVEAESAKNLAELFGLSRNVSYAKEKNMHCTAMFHILSEKNF
jgi:hypothetical protein